MKLLFILFICLPLITSAQTDSSFAPQIPKIPLNEAVKNILDFNCMVLELKDPLSPKEEVLVKSINRIYNESSFNELDSLFDHGNSLLQLYAFAGMCIKYKDSISDKHLFILSKKEMVKIYRQNAKKHPQKSIGEIASIFFNLEIKSLLKSSSCEIMSRILF
jgi:hypothetical protein